jgi:hypothetical protein
MAEIDLAFLARQSERIMADNASMRDELRVQTAMITRLDGAVAGFVQEVRAIHTWMARIDDRVRKLEDAGHCGVPGFRGAPCAKHEPSTSKRRAAHPGYWLFSVPMDCLAAGSVAHRAEARSTAAHRISPPTKDSGLRIPVQTARLLSSLRKHEQRIASSLPCPHAVEPDVRALKSHSGYDPQQPLRHGRQDAAIASRASTARR